MVGLIGLYVASLFLVDRGDEGYLTFWDGWLYAIATRHCLQTLRNKSSHELKHALFVQYGEYNLQDPEAHRNLLLS